MAEEVKEFKENLSLRCIGKLSKCPKDGNCQEIRCPHQSIQPNGLCREHQRLSQYGIETFSSDEFVSDRPDIESNYERHQFEIRNSYQKVMEHLENLMRLYRERMIELDAQLELVRNHMEEMNNILKNKKPKTFSQEERDKIKSNLRIAKEQEDELLFTKSECMRQFSQIQKRQRDYEEQLIDAAKRSSSSPPSLPPSQPNLPPNSDESEMSDLSGTKRTGETLKTQQSNKRTKKDD